MSHPIIPNGFAEEAKKIVPHGFVYVGIQRDPDGTMAVLYQSTAPADPARSRPSERQGSFVQRHPKIAAQQNQILLFLKACGAAHPEEEGWIDAYTIEQHMGVAFSEIEFAITALLADGRVEGNGGGWYRAGKVA